MNLGSFKPPGPPEVVVGDSDEVVGVVKRERSNMKRSIRRAETGK